MSGAVEAPPGRARISPAEITLLGSVFLIAACGLVYELAAGALASYLVGDSIRQFSTVIGTYLFAMGLGSWLSRFVERQLVAQFIGVELLVGAVGGLMPAGLFVAHNLLPASAAGAFQAILHALVLAVGALVGLEIPLVMRLLQRRFRERYGLKDLVSQVLTFDYLGALVVALAFPLLLVPQLGLIRTGLVFGLMNAGVAVWALWLFRAELRRLQALALAAGATVAVLLAALAGAERLTTWAEDRYYGDHILHVASSDYQRIVVTGGRAGLRLFLNGNLQFHERDEYRYHEALVHPAMAAHGAPRRVLVLGGGDGLAVREILKYPSVEQVTLVDLDAQVTRLFSTEPRLVALNRGALRSPKVTVVNADAFAWLEAQRDPAATWDVIVIDFPDPGNFAVGKLYSTSFYPIVDQHLAAGGFMVVQTTSPLVARRSFWTVAATLEAVGLTITPYHALVPSFGEWGFILAGHRPWHLARPLPEGLRFLTPEVMATLLRFPPDMARTEEAPNRLSDQRLVRLFEEEWGAPR